MPLDVKEKKSVPEMGISLAKTVFLVIGFAFVFATVFASLAVVPSVDHLFSTQSSVLITVHLIIAAIWKLSNARPRGDPPHNYHDIPVAPPPDPPETWYAVDPSSPTTSTTTTSPEFKSSSSPPVEPVISPETPEEEVASSSVDDGENSMDTTWRAIMEGGGRPAKPVLKKSQTWEKCKVVGEQAVVRREMRKSETFKEKAKAMVEEGWRKRDVLVVSDQDELFRRVETFIKKHHQNLRLQRQESERRRFLERLRRNY